MRRAREFLIADVNRSSVGSGSHVPDTSHDGRVYLGQGVAEVQYGQDDAQIGNEFCDQRLPKPAIAVGAKQTCLQSPSEGLGMDVFDVSLRS